MPLRLVAGEHDDITPREELFQAESLVGTPKGEIEKTVAPGGHIALFMRSSTRSGSANRTISAFA